MSIDIDNIQVSSVDDFRLVLNKSAWAADLVMGTNWNKLRIGWRFCLADTGGAIGGTPRLWIGLLSDPTAGLAESPLETTTTHFVGVYTRKTSWTRTAGPPIFYDCGGATNLMSIVKRVGTTNTETLMGSNFIPARQIPAQTDRRVVGLMDITRGSPNFTIDGVYQTSGSADKFESHLDIAMQVEPLANAASYLNLIATNYTGGTGGGTIAVDEATDGDLNAVCVAWSNTSNIYFSDIKVAKLA